MLDSDQKLKDIETESRETAADDDILNVPADDDILNVPADDELFAGDVHEKLSASQVFAGNEDFYKSLADSIQTAISQKTASVSQPLTPSVRPKLFSNVQKALAAGIALIASILLYMFFKPSIMPVSSQPPTPLTTPPTVPVGQTTVGVQQQIPEPTNPPSVGSVQTIAIQSPQPIPPAGTTTPFSLKVAQDLYLQKDYDKAYLVYEQLSESLPATAENVLLRDFLQFEKGTCSLRKGDLEQSSRLLKRALGSRSPIVKIAANYQLGLLEMQNKQFLNARTRFYQVIALIDAVEFDKQRVLPLQRDCFFLAGEAVSRNLFLLCDVDKDVPVDLWSAASTHDGLFINLDEKQLRSFLRSGSEQLSKALLSPQIQQFKHTGGLSRYSVACYGAPVEELLSRFAANAGLDVHWASSSDKIGVRNRAVCLYLPESTSRDIAKVVAGSCGLLANLDEKGLINIFDPVEYSYTSEHLALLGGEAISLWQKFLLKFHTDERLANAHFALGLLYSQQERFAESISEYKLIANRFVRSSLAPAALLNSSKLKSSLRDYPGARDDLKQLIEQFPDAEVSGRACLNLAEVTAKTELKSEAARLYRKAYNLELSSELQSSAAFGAGKCFYETDEHSLAVKWLRRYIELAQRHKAKNLYSGYLLLGKAYMALGNQQEAHDALRYALTGQLPREEYVSSISTVVEGYIEQGRLVEALDVLENTDSTELSQSESIEILLLNCRVLRAMGLTNEAIVALGDRDGYITDPKLKAQICLELTDCYLVEGNLEHARRKLSETLVITEAGALAQKITLKLADVCLKLGRDSQTVSFCTQLLDSEPPEQTKQKALELLSAAYNQQKNYDNAALALLGQWK